MSLLLAQPGPHIAGPGWSRWPKPVAVSLGLHLALAACVLGSGGGLGDAKLPEPAVLQTRMVAVSSAPSKEAAHTEPTQDPRRPLSEASLPAFQAVTPEKTEPLTTFTGLDLGKFSDARNADNLGRMQTAEGPSAMHSEQASERPKSTRSSPESARDSGYLGSGAVDRTAAPLEDVTPDYPPEAGLREGTVVLRLLISATGHVDAAQVLRATPKSLFESAASRAFLQARFSPAQRAGVDVASQLTIEVHFAPTNRDGGISGRLP